MNRAVLIDTGALYALAIASDQYHRRARSEHAEIIANQIEVIVLAPVLIETYNLILRRVAVSLAHRWLDEVAVITQLRHVSGDDVQQAIALVRRFADQPLSLVDGVLAV